MKFYLFLTVVNSIAFGGDLVNHAWSWAAYSGTMIVIMAIATTISAGERE
jgi:hypothetical protein